MSPVLLSMRPGRGRAGFRTTPCGQRAAPPRQKGSALSCGDSLQPQLGGSDLLAGREGERRGPDEVEGLEIRKLDHALHESSTVAILGELGVHAEQRLDDAIDDTAGLATG